MHKRSHRNFNFKKYAHPILYMLMIIVLSLPLLQYYFRLIPVQPLDGAFTLQEKPAITVKTWLSGDFQDKYVKHIEDHIGFREIFIRLYNQLNYSVFHLANSPGCVVGKDNQLFLRSYIEEYLGMDFMGGKYIDNKVKKLKFLQDYFFLKGKTLFLVFAPGKASFYPEKLPPSYEVYPKQLSNRDFYIKKCNEMHINFIDLNTYFRQLKNTSPYLLYPQNGVHWTSWGMYLGMDSIIHYIEKKRGIDLPELVVDCVKVSDSVVPPDNDVELNMNLVCPIPQPPLPHPEFSFVGGNDVSRPKVLVIADSYYWQVYGAYIHSNEFRFGGFWFYFKTAYNDQSWQGVPVDSLDVRKFLMDQDVIIIMGTEATMHLFPYGFADKVYELINPTGEETKIRDYIRKIKNDLEWLESTKEKAEKNNQTLEERLYIEAKYMVDQESGSEGKITAKIREAIDSIKSDPNRQKIIEEEALEKDLDPEALLLFKAEQKAAKREE